MLVKLKTNNGNYLVCSVYFSPNSDIEKDLEQLGLLMWRYPRERFVIIGDFNSRSPLWGPREIDERGEHVLTFINSQNIIIINRPDSLPTYDGPLGSVGSTWSW